MRSMATVAPMERIQRKPRTRGLLYNGFAKMLDAVKLRLDNASRRVREGGSDGVTIMMVVSEIDRLCIDEAY